MSQSREIPLRERVLGGRWGAVVGDELGVAVEFDNRPPCRPSPLPVCGLTALTTNRRARDWIRDCVLKAVNLGGERDTTGWVAGGLAGVAYGKEAVPADWISQWARRSDLESLFARFVALG